MEVNPRFYDGQTTLDELVGVTNASDESIKRIESLLAAAPVALVSVYGQVLEVVYNLGDGCAHREIMVVD